MFIKNTLYRYSTLIERVDMKQNYSTMESLKKLDNVRVLKSNYKDMGPTEVFRQVDTYVTHIEKMTMFERVNYALDKSAYNNMKVKPYVTPLEVRRIRTALAKYTSSDFDMKEFLDEKLNSFETEITEDYNNRIKEYTRKKNYSESQVKIVEGLKFKIVFDRLSQAKWPYCNATKDCDEKIKAFTKQAEIYGKRIVQLQQTTPVADEKMLLKFKIKIKDQLEFIKSRQRIIQKV